MVGIVTDLSSAMVSPEDVAYTTTMFKEVWDKQGMKVEMGYIIPNEMNVLEAVEKRVAKKVTQFIDEIKMFAGANWKIEMKNFRDAALANFRAEEMKEVLIQNFEESLNQIDWKTAVLEDTNGNYHKIVLISNVQVVTQSMDSYFVWHKATGESMMLGCEDLRIVVKL